MSRCSVTDITELARRNREIAEAVPEVEDTDDELNLMMPFMVLALFNSLKTQKRPYTMDDYTPIAQFNDKDDAMNYAKTRNIWAKDKYPSYIVFNAMDTAKYMCILTDCGGNIWKEEIMNEA